MKLLDSAMNATTKISEVKKNIFLLLFLLILVFAHAQVWVPDNSDSTYKNPIIYADYSDPDVILVGDDFCMVSSSFTVQPGILVLHSIDLVHWKFINHVYKTLPFQKFQKPPAW